MNNVGQWVAYFDAGDFIGNFTVNGDLHVTGSADVDTNLNVDGSVTVTTDVTVTGKIKFTGDRVKIIPHVSAKNTSAGIAWTLATDGWTVADTNYLLYPVEIEDGYRITHFAVYGNKSSSGATTLTAELTRLHKTTGTAGLVGAGASTSANAPGAFSLLEAVNHTTDFVNYSYFIKVYSSTNAADKFFHAEIQYDRPA